MAGGSTEAFSQTVRVRYEECGPGGQVRASAYMRYLQDLAFAHSAARGYPLAWYERQRRFWLVRRVHLVVHAPARYSEDLITTTQVVGMRRVLARRHNTVRRTSDDRLVATAVVDWIFTQDGVAPIRVPQEMVAAFPVLAAGTTSSPLPEPLTPAGAEWLTRRIRLSDLDAMGHANNAVYVDLLDDAVSRAGGDADLGAYPRTYLLQFHAAAGAGAALRDLAWREQDAWHYRLEAISGLLLLHGRLHRGA